MCFLTAHWGLFSVGNTLESTELNCIIGKGGDPESQARVGGGWGDI